MAQATPYHAEPVVPARNRTGECPLWQAAEQALYWVDIPQKTLHRYQPGTGAHRTWHAPQMLGCIALGAQVQTLLAGAEQGFYRLHTGDAAALGWEYVAEAGHARPGMRFNDGRCDRQGRFTAGSMALENAGAERPGHVAQLQPDGTVRTLLRGFATPNGMAFSPDGRRMYLSDSHPSVRQIWVYDYDTDAGVPHHPRPFVDMAGFCGRPDGAAMDTDGGYWICGIDAGLVHRYTPQGVLDMTVSVPARKPTMCAFGGADLRTLYVTSLTPGAAEERSLHDGALFAVQLPSVQGMPEPHCCWSASQ